MVMEKVPIKCTQVGSLRALHTVYGLGLRLISVVAARAAFCILFCVTPFISMNGMKPVHITKKARATTGTFAGK